MTPVRLKSSRSILVLVVVVFAAVLAFLGVTSRLKVDSIPSEVRVRNDTGLALSDVTVNKDRYGDIAIGGVTAYRNPKQSVGLPSFSLSFYSKLDTAVEMSSGG